MYSRWKQEVGDPILPKDWPPRARLGINGCGYVARLLIRCAIFDKRGIDVVAINVPDVTPELLIYLLKYDSQYGPCPGVVSREVSVTKPEFSDSPPCTFIEVCGRKIAVFHYKHAEDIPWNWLDVEYVIETNPNHIKLSDAEKHLRGGRARKVIVVGDTFDIPHLVYPINCMIYHRGTSIISTGSAEAMAVGTLTYLLEKQFGILEAIATITSSYNEKERPVDSPCSETWRMGRGASQSIIPIPAEAALRTVIQAVPSMREKIQLTAFTVPSATGSILDFTCRLKKPVKEISELLDGIREGEVRQAIETLHAKCQPGWLLRDWCPQNVEVSNSEIPTLVCEKTEDKSEYKPAKKNESSNTENSAKQVVDTRNKEANVFMENELKDSPPKIVEFWTGDQLLVGEDVKCTKSMTVLDINSCLSLKDGTMFKVIAWFDKDMSFCLRILDTIVFMRYVDHG